MKLEELTEAPGQRRPFLKRFWNKVRKTKHCWEWTSLKVQHGYGQIKANGKRHYAHRVAFLIEHGEIDDALCVLHSCDNRICVNPAHLFQGTKGDNARDRDAKGRQLKGEQCPLAKLTERAVLQMREQWKTMTAPQIAALHGVTEAHAYDVVIGACWKHLGGERHRKNRMP